MREAELKNEGLFTLETAVEVLSNVKTDERNELSKSSLFGKRRNETMQCLKDESTCRVCGEAGHWWRDRMECREKFTTKQKMMRDQKRRKWTNNQKIHLEEPKGTPDDDIYDLNDETTELIEPKFKKRKHASLFQNGGK